MSGSNGPDYSFGAGAGGTSCSGITRHLALQAPDSDIVATLEVGDLMELILHDGDAPTIAVTTSDGNEAGAIMPDQALIDCLRLGVRYVAEARSISGGQVLLAVRAE